MINHVKEASSATQLLRFHSHSSENSGYQPHIPSSPDMIGPQLIVGYSYLGYPATGSRFHPNLIQFPLRYNISDYDHYIGNAL